MRNFITIVENNLGQLYQTEDGEGVGYWYNPKTQQSHVITWDAEAEGTYTDHCDVALDHPDWFGLDPNEGWGDCDHVRMTVVQNGWVRMNYAKGNGLGIDARNAKEAFRAYIWFEEHHGTPETLVIDLYLDGGENYKAYHFQSDAISDYSVSGKLEPANMIRSNF